MAGQPRPAGGFELWAWFFMRISGLLLLILALGHLFIMHVFNSVENINYDFVARRYATLGWRLYDLTLLSLALLHGFNGLRILVDDYIHSEGWRAFWLATICVLTFLFLLVGAAVILTFPLSR
jgi:succinate dehydrogenase / fumarate reductase membrane anchor subunit